MGEARALVEEHYDGLNSGDIGRSMESHADDVEVRTPTGPLQGVAQFREYVQPFFTALPNAKLLVDNMIEVGDTVVIEGRFTGEHTGPLPSPQGEIPATGRSIDLPYCDVFRVENGKIASHHTYYDQVSFMAQLGLMPEPGQA